MLEHVPDPVGFVQAATLRLQPGGVIFIEVPCRDWEHKNLEEPHILFFDKVPMSRLLIELGFADIEVGYYGQPISELKSITPLKKLYARVRAKLISWGIVMPFAIASAGMNRSVSSLERALVRPYKAHQVSTEPAWWLRAIARKK